MTQKDAFIDESILNKLRELSVAFGHAQVARTMNVALTAYLWITRAKENGETALYYTKDGSCWAVKDDYHDRALFLPGRLRVVLDVPVAELEKIDFLEKSSGAVDFSTLITGAILFLADLVDAIRGGLRLGAVHLEKESFRMFTFSDFAQIK